MVLKESKLIKHQIYFFQSSFGVQWIMPISEQNWDGERVDVITSVSLNDLTRLSKLENLIDYLVERKQPVGIYSKKSQSIWDVPKDKYGLELYKHYSIKISSMSNDIVIPIDIVENEYPELIITVSNKDRFCNGIPKEKEARYRREIILKSLLNE